MSGSSPTYNYPAQPTYGEGMADAMKAQMQQLLGQGDYADIYAKAGFEGGNFGDILAGVEAPIRKQTAQIDTDVMRQTLLGGEQKVVKDPETGKYGIPGAEIVTSEQVGNAPTQSAGGGYHLIGAAGGVQIFNTNTGGTMSHADELKELERQGLIESQGKVKPPGEGSGSREYYKVTSQGKQAGLPVTTLGGSSVEWFGDPNMHIDAGGGASFRAGLFSPEKPRVGLTGKLKGTVFEGFSSNLAATAADQGVPESEVKLEFEFTNPNTGKPLQEGDVVREGTGMVDLLGDKRGVQQAVQSEDYAKYVKDNPDLQAAFDAKRQAGENITIEEYGQDHYDKFGKAEGRELAMGEYSMQDVGRQAGFDESGQFLGLSALAEDVQAGNLSRQRERDLQDVSRLSGLYSDIMEDYKPGTKAALTGASEVLEAQKAALTGAGAIDAPGSVATGMGDITSGGMTAAQAGLPADLKAATQYKATSAAAIDPLSAATSYTPSAGVSGGAYGGALGADPATLRSDLLADAQTSLTGGLTQREERQISEAMKAQSTMMGRTFDQSAGIAEAKARTLEDRNRQAINRQYAQQVLGQEAGLQESDLGRGLQAQLANQQATNRAAEYGVGAGLQQEQAGAQFAQQTALANQQAANRAAEFGVGAGMQQELAGAQMNLQTALANQAAQQDAAKYTAQEGIQAQLANEANRQQAASFDVNALQQQQRLNEQLKQAGTLGYVDAATRLAALEDTTTLDPFQAVLGRTGGGSLQAGQGVFGQAGYGLQSGPQYLNAESGLGFIQNQATNAANMFGAQSMADATVRGSKIAAGGNILSSLIPKIGG